MTCEYCDDGDGGCVYPYYGEAPHEHVVTVMKYRGEAKEVVGMEYLPQSEWPENFKPDKDAIDDDGTVRKGIYTHCLHCGGGGDE